MFCRWYLIPASLTLIAAADQPWKDEKQIAAWSEDDARQVLSDSPWAKTATATFQRQSQGRSGSRGGMGRGGGIGLGIPGVGIGMGGPRMGGGRGGGMGRNGPRGGDPGEGGEGRPAPRTPPALTVRWESALPVQEAVLKLQQTDAPTIDEGHYAVSVAGLPARLAEAGRGKPQAELKRSGRKAIKSSEARIISRDDGAMVVFLFPRSKEIVAGDKEVEFHARIGPLEVKQSFALDAMKYDGKLEL